MPTAILVRVPVMSGLVSLRQALDPALSRPQPPSATTAWRAAVNHLMVASQRTLGNPGHLRRPPLVTAALSVRRRTVSNDDY
jgi:hypothetical protein